MKKILGLEIKWWQTFVFSFIFLVILSAYNSINKQTFDIFVVNRSLADLAFILAAISMSLASISYLFKKFQRYIAYRMHLGITAFFVGLAHVLLADYFYFFAVNPPKPNFEFGHVWPLLGGLTASNVLAFICGILAILLFAFMSLITLKYFMLKLGGLVWRKSLRYSGFTALGLVLIHFLIKNLDIWLHPQNWGTLPPINLLLWILGVVVLLLRLTMWIKLSRNKPTLTKTV